MLNTVRYITISTLFILILVVFMVFNPGVYTTPGNSDMTNVITRAHTGTSVGAAGGTASAGGAMRQDIGFSIVADSDRDPALLNCVFTLQTLKLEYTVYDSIGGFLTANAEPPHTLIIVSRGVGPEDAAGLVSFLERGGNVIFAVMPRAAAIESEELSELLGIIEVQTDYTIEGADIYEGLLLGGMFSAQEITFDCYNVLLDGKCRVYATGNNPDRDKNAPYIAREDKAPLIWRKHYGSGMLFAVNAPFMSQSSGLGILTGIISVSSDAFIYPIIGAKSIILDSFPYIADSTQQVSGRGVTSFLRDIMFPDLISMAIKLDITYSCFTNGSFNKAYDAIEVYSFFETQVKKAINGEMGYSVGSDPNIFASDIEILAENGKIEGISSYMVNSRDLAFEASNPNLDYTAMIVRDAGLEDIEWISERAVALPLISEDIGGDVEALDFIGAMSLLGVVLHSIDISIPIEDEENGWHTYAIDLATYIAYLDEKSSFLQSMTVSQTAEAVKNYLNTSASITRTGQGFHVEMAGNKGEASFILRTALEVDTGINCTVEEIDENMYMVRSAGPQFEIILNQKE